MSVHFHLKHIDFKLFLTANFYVIKSFDWSDFLHFDPQIFNKLDLSWLFYIYIIITVQMLMFVCSTVSELLFYECCHSCLSMFSSYSFITSYINKLCTNYIIFIHSLYLFFLFVHLYQRSKGIGQWPINWF